MHVLPNGCCRIPRTLGDPALNPAEVEVTQRVLTRLDFLKAIFGL